MMTRITTVTTAVARPTASTRILQMTTITYVITVVAQFLRLA